MSDDSPVFGRLEPVELRSAWTREDTEFTPWLAEEANVRLLSETLGLDLVLHAQEQSVGPFRADLIFKNSMDGSIVLVENQLERTDHGHLGQIITYAAGLDAVTIVWIASRFTEEHRAALDWLNEVSHENIRFFGIQIELWRIGSSSIAPRLNLLAKPNDWSKTVREATTHGGLTEAQKTAYGFWSALIARLQDANSDVSANRTPAKDYWMEWGIGRSDLHLEAAVGFRDGWISAGVTVRDSATYAALESQRTQIDDGLGTQPDWDYAESRKQNYIRIRKTVQDAKDRDKWPEYCEWLVEHLGRFDRVFRPLLATLPPIGSSAG